MGTESLGTVGVTGEDHNDPQETTMKPSRKNKDPLGITKYIGKEHVSRDV